MRRTGADVAWLSLSVLGDRRTVHAPESLTFGRRADLVVDDNPYMHRVVGRLVHRQGAWWLQNHGSSVRLELRNPANGTAVRAGPGDQLPVPSVRFTISFVAGPTTYELDGRRSGGELATDHAGTLAGTSTLDFGAVPLSPEQHLLIVALHDSATRNHGAIEGSSVIARRLGWTPKKFHRKLDAVCLKLDRQGVRGLKGGPGDLAESRRTVLLEHALNTGLVGAGDLGLLGNDPPTTGTACTG